jgi:iron complex transport system substrate-binding protein
MAASTRPTDGMETSRPPIGKENAMPLARRIALVPFRAALAALVVSLAVPSFSNASSSAEIVLTDAAGRTVRLAAPPTRIVAIGEGPYIIAHLLYMFPEGRIRLLGMERRGPIATEFLPLIDPAFEKEKAFLDMNPGPEQIAPLRPDLVLVRGTKADARAEALSKLEIPVLYLETEDFDGYAKDLRNLGRILGNPGRAEEIIEYYRAKRESVAGAVAGPAESEKPRLLLAMVIPRAGKIAVQVPAQGWMQTRMALAAGSRPVWTGSSNPTSGWTVVNLEQIAAWNPDRINLIVWHSLEPKKILADFKADPRWAALKAVRENALRIFPADVYGWDLPDPRWILGLQWLSAGLHPQRFPGFDIDKEMDEFFGRLFGMDRASVTSLIRPKIRMELR